MNPALREATTEVDHEAGRTTIKVKAAGSATRAAMRKRPGAGGRTADRPYTVKGGV
jgi:hypothetical protein